MARSRMIALLGAATLVLGACGGAGAKAVTVQLATQNDTGVTGSAVLTDLGNGKTKVEVTANPNGNNNMLAHIHPGTCATLDPAPKYPLSNVENGKSTTEVAVKLADIQTGAFAINLHKSAAEAAVYTACGDIPKT